MKKCDSKFTRFIPTGVPCLVIIVAIFCYIGSIMGVSEMFKTIMNTAHGLLLNTVFYLMAVCVITGAICRLFIDFGVVDLLERLLRPFMKPLFNMPGVASISAVITFLSDNPALITLAKDNKFRSFFKKYQYISLTNFGTAFGLGLVVIVFMLGQGYSIEPFIGLFGAVVGCMVSTRMMQYYTIKLYPNFKDEDAGQLIVINEENDEAEEKDDAKGEEKKEEQKKTLLIRILDSVLDGGKTGVDVGMGIIPGVLIISTLIMIFTFGPDKVTGEYTGAAYEGISLLPDLAEKVDWLFAALFGFTDPHQVAFPITSLGTVSAALSLIPDFKTSGWIDSNAICVFTAMGMCWSGYLTTHTAMLDALGYRQLTTKAIWSHTIGGLIAGIVAHYAYLSYAYLIA